MIQSVNHHGTGKPSPASVELKIDSDPANLREVRQRIEDFAQAAGMPKEGSDELGLVINEALANVIRHGYGGATDRPIVVTADLENGAVRITIRDWAKPFDPAAVPQKKTADVTPGGLGLLCMKKLMDEVRFSRLSDGMLLTMIKRVR
ncbi:MAG: ATP-binding protein [Tepidisphaeraceae bacterium]|jgi:anti-sigma regulatory factor (Ser/Thr protein kinase)